MGPGEGHTGATTGQNRKIVTEIWPKITGKDSVWTNSRCYLFRGRDTKYKHLPMRGTYTTHVGGGDADQGDSSANDHMWPYMAIYAYI